VVHWTLMTFPKLTAKTGRSGDSYNSVACLTAQRAFASRTGTESRRSSSLPRQGDSSNKRRSPHYARTLPCLGGAGRQMPGLGFKREGRGSYRRHPPRGRGRRRRGSVLADHPELIVHQVLALQLNRFPQIAPLPPGAALTNLPFSSCT
jgi:hypothetical protein